MTRLTTLAAFTAALVVTLQRTFAIPIFDQINHFDINGQTCPLGTQFNVSCPILCVKDPKLCPTSLAQTCPPGQTFCGDGSCKSDCTGIANVCLCGGDAATAGGSYTPCAMSQYVDIPNYKSSTKDAQTAQTCEVAAKLLGGSVGAWGSGNASVWLACPVSNPYFTWTEPMWLSVWGLAAAEAFILLAWHAYKTVVEKAHTFANSPPSSHCTILQKFHRAFDNALTAGHVTKDAAVDTTEADASEKDADAADKGKQKEEPFVATKKAKTNTANDDIESVPESERLKFRGFDDDYFGIFAFASVILTTIGWLLFLAIIVADYCTRLRQRCGLWRFSHFKSLVQDFLRRVAPNHSVDDCGQLPPEAPAQLLPHRDLGSRIQVCPGREATGTGHPPRRRGEDHQKITARRAGSQEKVW
ncbi:hypothetical protein BC936DRAFT_141687, partial [Jimgerdemannia flammicorona]